MFCNGLSLSFCEVQMMQTEVMGSYWEPTSILLCSEAFQRINGSYQVIVNLRADHSDHHRNAHFHRHNHHHHHHKPIIITIIRKKQTPTRCLLLKSGSSHQVPQSVEAWREKQVTLNHEIFLFSGQKNTNTKSELDTYEMVNLSGTESSPLITGLSIELYGKAT